MTDNGTYQEPEPMRCPECGGEVVTELEARTGEIPVYSTYRGAAWIGPFDFDGVEWELSIGVVGCTECGWSEKVHDYEVGTL